MSSTDFAESREPIDITPDGSVAPVYLVALTPAEEAEREEMSRIDAKQKVLTDAKLAAKESALAKLSLLGLTEEEAKAVIGL
jgi:hypothetical protein